MTVSVLGTEYVIEYRNEKDDKILEDCDGYTDLYSKIIVVTKDETGNIHDFKRYQRKVLRHEIVHAFLYESGIAHNALKCDDSWAMNEEMVDFFAIQGEKIHKAWSEVNALD